MDTATYPGIEKEYRPPPHVKKEIMRHAVRKYIDKNHVMSHCYPKSLDYSQGIEKHKFDSGGRLQWAFMN